MGCKVCGNLMTSRTIANIPMCEKCFKKLDMLRNGDMDMIKYFSSPEAYEKATNEAKMYFVNIVQKKMEEIRVSQENERLQIEEQKKIDSFICTTTNGFDNYRVTSYLGMISGEFVIGTGFLAEMEANHSDFFGNEAVLFTNKIYEARQEAINLMKKRGVKKGASAAIGVTFDVTTIGKNMIIVCVNGTAVNIEKI